MIGAMPEWYVDQQRNKINFSTALPALVPSVDIYRIVVGADDAQFVARDAQLSYLWARAGQAVRAEDKAAAIAAQSTVPVPAVLMEAPTIGQGNVSAPDATATSKGVVQLAGDIGGTAASPTVAGVLRAQNNLTDLASTATARTSLGLGTAATQPVTAFTAAPATPVASSATSGTLTAGAEHTLTPASAATRTLPTGVTSTAITPTTVKNNGTANVTIARGGSDTINGGTASIVVAPGEWARLASNGSGAWTAAGTYGQTGTYAGRLQTKIRAAAARSAARNPLLLGPMSSPPALTTASTDQSTGLGLVNNFRPSTSAANLARFRVIGGVGQVYSSSYYTAWSYTMGDATNGNTLGDATHQSYRIAVEWVTDSPWFQLRQLARTSGFQLYVDDQPVSGNTLATSTNYGGTSFTLIDWSAGSATITASSAVFTTSAAHGFQVGDVVYLGAITTTTGVTANIPYFVLTTPTATTFTLSATLGGSALTLTGDGSTARVAKAVTRKYTLEFNVGAILEVNILATGSLYPPQEDTLRVCTVGDSIDAMTGANRPEGGWQFYAGKLLGWTDVRAVSFGGTGFTTAAAHGNTFGAAQRVADVVTHNPDLLVITLSQNDEPNAATTLQAAALAGFQAYRAALPNVPIVVVGVDASSTGVSAPSASRLAVETYGKAAFDQWADSNSYFIPNSSDTGGAWFTGTGYAGAKTNSGNRDIYGFDAAHPNDAGHKYIAARFAASFRRIVLPALIR